MTLESAIKHYEEKAAKLENTADVHAWNDDGYSELECLNSAKKHRQLAEWLRELKKYRKQIQNLIDNESFEIVNPFNTYEYARVVRVADLYDLIEVNADE